MRKFIIGLACCALLAACDDGGGGSNTNAGGGSGGSVENGGSGGEPDSTASGGHHVRHDAEPEDQLPDWAVREDARVEDDAAAQGDAAVHDAGEPDAATEGADMAVGPGVPGFTLIPGPTPKMLPGAPSTLVLHARNSGTAAWTAEHAHLSVSYEMLSLGGISLDAETAPGADGTFTGSFAAPAAPGLRTFQVAFEWDGELVGDPVDVEVEVTCDDSVFCNGPEHFVDGACAGGRDPCDDEADCTIDACDEATGRCDHALGEGDCAVCAAAACEPDCEGRLCGGDGCGGSCGDCADGEACASSVGECRSADQAGSCAAPFPLVGEGEALLGDHVVEGDTTNALHQVVPACNNTSTAVEHVYVFTVASQVGYDFRSYGYDTVIHLRREDEGTPASDCTDDSPLATLNCADDSAPPGDYGSRIDGLLDPGTYYLIVDGFDNSQFGPYQLTARFRDACQPHCDGIFCGDDGCGHDCGPCGEGEICADARCRPDPCVPSCDGHECGSDGCGGECGQCADGTLCVTATQTCQAFPECDHHAPTCEPGCGAGEFCGVDCVCHAADAPMADIVVEASRLENEVLIDSIDVNENSCSVVENCVTGPGHRRLLRFSVEAVNQGQATLSVPPPAERPDLFLFSQCHGHFHFNGFATYELLDLEGNVILTGHKQAYCMEDTQQVAVGPNVGCEKVYNCDDQSIQAGWSDLYGNALDCQWIDITDQAPGDYQLRVRLNPERVFEEASFDNNDATVPVQIPEE
jgi:hypothetical protein